MLKPGLTLVADDLTGAAEVAAGLCPAWESCLIDWRHASRFLPPHAGQALTVNTGSRHLSEREAGERVASVLAALPQDAWVYKKCDSTLRGPIGAEVAAVRAHFPRRPLWYVGATPGAGRVVREGKLLVNGTPVAETEFASDPLAPVKTSSIFEVLGQAGMAASLWQPGDAVPDGSGVVVADAESAEDLAAVIEAAGSLNPLPVFAGAGGFVAFLSMLAGPETEGLAALGDLAQPILVVNGSLNPSGLAQVRAAEQAGVPALGLSAECFFGSGAESTLRAKIPEGSSILASGGPLLVRTAAAAEESVDFRRAADASGLSGTEVYEVITNKLAGFVGDLLRETGSCSLICFGGELSEAVWHTLRIESAEVQGFVQDHLAVSNARTEEGREFLFAIKPGGFGEPDLLRRLLGE